MFLLVAQLTAVIGVSVAIWLQHRHEDLQNTGVETSPSARSLVEAAASTLQFGGIDGLKNLLQNWQKRPVLQLLAIDNNGKELLNRSYKKTSFDVAMALAEDDMHQRHAKQIKLSNGQSFLLFVPDDSRSYSLAPRPAEIKLYKGASRKASGRFPLMPVLGGIVVSLIFAALLAWYFSKPINILRTAFEQASHGKLDVRVANAMGGRRDELSDLGHDFDAMASRLESLLQSQTKLLHHISHELRSPLARIQMALGLVRQSPQKIAEFLDRITLEANRMDGLVGELLTLSRLESGAVQIKKETLALNQLMHSIIEDAQFEAASKNMKLCMSLDNDYTLHGQPDLLYRAIENVVRNAIKYGPNDSEINIACSKSIENQQIYIAVTDQGDGVDTLELEDIFKPFIRGNSGSQTVGHGVGLAITKQVIEAHGGHALAKNTIPQGFCVEISLPYSVT
ncbi:HAMP domain-containing sensor histidine kinase [Methylotenera sp. L2L1]|uniref:HAMP domain-containing sensor histidine kinase n=1 Tax=Methylotenera sp. L2L1 TaxID=1502770 RepID=UPI000B312314|nr:ATP-binding protein [Methylotenera sp. L2L1]